MDIFYSRLHQDLPWDLNLLPRGELSQSSQANSSSQLCADSTTFAPFSSFEEKRAKVEKQAQSWLEDLTALGVIGSLYQVETCFGCKGVVKHEARYKCVSCKKLFHVRCLPAEPFLLNKQTYFWYNSVCTVCKASPSLGVVDVMGVLSN